MQVEEVLNDVIRLVIEEDKAAKKKSGDVVFVKDVFDITIDGTINQMKPAPSPSKNGHRMRGITWVKDRIPAIFMYLHPSILTGILPGIPYGTVGSACTGYLPVFYPVF